MPGFKSQVLCCHRVFGTETGLSIYSLGRSSANENSLSLSLSLASSAPRRDRYLNLQVLSQQQQWELQSTACTLFFRLMPRCSLVGAARLCALVRHLIHNSNIRQRPKCWLTRQCRPAGRAFTVPVHVVPLAIV